MIENALANEVIVNDFDEGCACIRRVAKNQDLLVGNRPFDLQD
ncbi:MAG: hypothetical protein O3A13_06945 [Proteobacteria bacterium]|nr:hypothetical protein [Pseudomonadota bacterium]MDA0993356.1 hypothetical protein [Pseudomonadota bacterium]